MRRGISTGGNRTIVIATVVFALVIIAALNRFVSPPGAETEQGNEAATSNVPASTPPPFMRDEAAKSAHIEELVNKSGGDFNKLTQDEQRFMQTVSVGHGQEMLRMRADKKKNK